MRIGTFSRSVVLSMVLLGVFGCVPKHEVIAAPPASEPAIAEFIVHHLLNQMVPGPNGTQYRIITMLGQWNQKEWELYLLHVKDPLMRLPDTSDEFFALPTRAACLDRKKDRAHPLFETFEEIITISRKRFIPVHKNEECDDGDISYLELVGQGV